MISHQEVDTDGQRWHQELHQPLVKSSKVLFASIVMAVLMAASVIACGQAVHAGSTGGSSGGASVELVP